MIYNSVSGNILNAGSYGICDFQMSISKKAIDYKRNGEQTAIFRWPGMQFSGADEKWFCCGFSLQLRCCQSPLRYDVISLPE